MGFTIVALGTGMTCRGAMQNLRMIDTGIAGVGAPRIDVRGLGVIVNGNAYGNAFTLVSDVDGSIIYEIGSLASGEGVCNDSALGGVASCSNNTDCGGLCDATSATTDKIQSFCTVDADNAA